MVFGILSLFFNIPMLLVVLGIIAVVVIIYFTLGPVTLVKIVLDWRVWVIVGGIVLLVALWHSSTKIEAQKVQIDTAAVVQDASTDTLAVVTHITKQKQVRKVSEDHAQAVIDSAKHGDELDALMDEIAREQSPSVRPGH